jgi:hypothetical protein
MANGARRKGSQGLLGQNLATGNANVGVRNVHRVYVLPCLTPVHEHQLLPRCAKLWNRPSYGRGGICNSRKRSDQELFIAGIFRMGQWN